MARPRRGLDPLWAALGGLLLLFLALPLGLILAGAPPAALWQTLHDGEVLRSARVTLLAAALATATGLALGVPLAYLLARRAIRGRRWVEALLGLPVIIPHTAAGVALLLTYGARGALGAPLARVGVALTDRLAGIVMAMVFVSVPLLVSSAREAIAAVSPDLEEAAHVDGASPWQTFWRIVLPCARRGIASGALLMWARGISEFGAVVLLAYHPRTLAVLVYERFQGFGLNAAAPLSALLILLALLVFVALGALAAGDEDARD
ncbi:MAG: ABC transporter permease [Chloroflexi bacterium]|jgi:molybdate/tungstate transport system permease protein|nr:ABC transporter permease [Chloroflexota bacterium]